MQYRFVATVVLVASAGCHSDAPLFGTHTTCEPGRTETCACPDGWAGTRECKPDGSGFDECGGCANGAGGSGGTATSSSSAGTGGATSSSGVGGVGAGGVPSCTGASNVDNDGDGVAEDQGDCNDCSAAMGPQNAELLGNSIDDNCDGKVDILPTCDSNINIDTDSAYSASNAIGLCKFYDFNKSHDWGVVDARWVQIDGEPPPLDPVLADKYRLGYGMPKAYGQNNVPPEGNVMLALSTGIARPMNHYQYVSKNYVKGYTAADAGPVFWPQTPQIIYDSVALELQIKAPANATSYSFKTQVMMSQWPSQLDAGGFVVYTIPASPGSNYGNIVIDPTGYPITARAAFMQVCGCPNGTPCWAPPNAAQQDFTCKLGSSLLLGTPFESDVLYPTWTNGSTGWLRTTAVLPANNVFTIRFAIADFGNAAREATALIDGWEWGTDSTTETVQSQ